MEWRRGFLALTGPPSLGQELEVGKAQSPQVAESFCLPGVSPFFLPPIFLSPSRIHSLPSPLRRGREAGPIPILEEKEGLCALPPPTRWWRTKGLWRMLGALCSSGSKKPEKAW